MIEGTCDPRFEAVSKALEDNLASGLDTGASVAVSLDGQMVVDIWGGTQSDGVTPWHRDSIINVWSSTKTMMALSCLILADRGEIDFHAPVAKYWPEFAANGKGAIEVRHLLSHAAGLSGWAEPMTTDDLYDWDKATGILARQAPWWEPGTQSGYHAITEGFLVGEVVRRATGITLGDFFAKEVAGPLGADFHIGTPPECDDRVTLVIAPPNTLGADMDPSSIAFRTLTNPLMHAEVSHTIPWRRAEIAAANGHGNARSVALIQSIVSNEGTLNGQTFLSPAGVAKLFDVQQVGTDLVLGVPMRLGIGYGISGEEVPLSPSSRACFWGGWGGSLVINDLDNRLTMAFMMNKMGVGTTGDERVVSLLTALYGSLAAA